MKKLLLIVGLISLKSPVFSRDDVAKFDANRNPAMLGITSGSELRMLKTDSNGVLLTSAAPAGVGHVVVDAGTVTANVSNTGFRVLNVTTTTFDGVSQPVYNTEVASVTFGGTAQPVELQAGASVYILQDPAEIVTTKDYSIGSKSYVYVSSEVISAGTISLTGTGSSWSARVLGGGMTFNIDSGNDIILQASGSMSGQFKFPIANPDINITSLDSGATAYVFMDGGN